MFEIDGQISMTALKKKKVIDNKGATVGTIIDAVFDRAWNLHSFIIGGNFWEELRESLGIIEDIDPVVPIETITEISDKEIKLQLTQDDLKHKLEEGAVPEHSYWYSVLKRKIIKTEDEQKIGKIVNILFLPNNLWGFIIGGSRMEELLESIGLLRDYDFFLPPQHIRKVTENEIQIDVKKENLERTLNEKLLSAAELSNVINQATDPSKLDIFAFKKFNTYI